MTSPRAANLEQIFQKVEEETEKRALAAELRASSRQQNYSRASSPHHLTPVSSVATLNSASSHRRDRERRRGSVSISRFGQPEPAEPIPLSISRTGSKITHFAVGSLYGQPQSRSVDSFGSDTPATAPIDSHVTQVRHISGKKSISRVGGLLSRPVSRSRSANNLKPALDTPPNVVIGISVEEDTVEHEHEGYDYDYDGPRPESRSTSTVHAPLKKTRSTSGSGWVTKFSKALRRRSRTFWTDDKARAVHQNEL